MLHTFLQFEIFLVSPQCTDNTIYFKFPYGICSTCILYLLWILFNFLHLLLSRLDLLAKWSILNGVSRGYLLGNIYAIFWKFQFRIGTYGWQLVPTLCIVLVTCKTTINVTEDTFVVNNCDSSDEADNGVDVDGNYMDDHSFIYLIDWGLTSL